MKKSYQCKYHKTCSQCIDIRKKKLRYYKVSHDGLDYKIPVRLKRLRDQYINIPVELFNKDFKKDFNKYLLPLY